MPDPIKGAALREMGGLPNSPIGDSIAIILANIPPCEM